MFCLLRKLCAFLMVPMLIGALWISQLHGNDSSNEIRISRIQNPQSCYDVLMSSMQDLASRLDVASRTKAADALDIFYNSINF